ncbi:genetic competence negative regulator [Bacillaceae bacterium]
MRLERLSQDKIRIFLTSDDLRERGIEKEDMWRDIPKVHELFNDMMEQAYDELGFEVSGPVAVEVFALPSQGMVVIVTRGKNEAAYDAEEIDEAEFYDFELALEDEAIVYSFAQFDDLIDLAHRLKQLPVNGGSVYHYKDHYYFILDNVDWEDERLDEMIALISEYGEPALVTSYVIKEYGKAIIKEDAVKTISEHFRP